MSSQLITRPFHVLVLLQTSYKSHRDVLRGLVRYARLNGSWILHILEGRDDESSQNSVDPNAFDGALIGATARYEELLQKIKIPTIVVDPRKKYNSRETRNDKYSVVCCDNEAVGRKCAEFFLKTERFHFGYIPAITADSWSKERATGFCNELNSRGFESYVYRLSEKADEDAAKLQDWLRKLPKPIAVMTATDARGRQTMDACRALGLNVPGDVALIGVDNDELLCESTVPFLSSVAVNLEETIFQAADVLDRQMKDETRCGQVFYYDPIKIVERGSTARTLTDDPLVLSAVELIKLNIHRSFGVEEIAKKMDVSRRTLELRFRNRLGRSILEVVRDARLEKVKLLLLETDRSVATIARLCGFKKENYLATVFRERFKTTTTEFRRNKGA